MAGAWWQVGEGQGGTRVTAGLPMAVPTSSAKEQATPANLKTADSYAGNETGRPQNGIEDGSNQLKSQGDPKQIRFETSKHKAKSDCVLLQMLREWEGDFNQSDSSNPRKILSRKAAFDLGFVQCLPASPDTRGKDTLIRWACRCLLMRAVIRSTISWKFA